MNRLIREVPLYDAQQFAEIELSEQTRALLEQNPQRGEAPVRLNRHFLAAAYPQELAAPAAQPGRRVLATHLPERKLRNVRKFCLIEQMSYPW